MSFVRKKDAISKIIKSNNKNLRLIQKDIDENGMKKFFVWSQNDLYNTISKYKKKNKTPNFYESWLSNTRIVFSLDIDAPKDLTNEEFDKLITKNIKTVIKNVNIFYEYTYKVNNIIVMKTKKQPNKQSAHVVFRGLGFENHLICKNLFFRIVKQDKLPYCDSAIYGKTCLRTCYSSKKGKEYPLLPYKLKIGKGYTTVPEDYESELDFFVQSLITTIDDLENKTPMITKGMIVEETDLESTVKKKKIQIDNDGELEEIMNSLPQEYCDDYLKWNRVGMALFSISDTNFEIFNKWSMKSSKYSLQNVQKHWDGYKSCNFNKNVLGIGSLIYWAKEGGYKFPDKNTENIVKSYPENKIVVTKNDSIDIEYLSKRFLTEKIFEEIIDRKFIAIQSEKGTGKTSNLIKLLFESKKKPPESVLFISSRRTFGIKLSADLKKYGFQLYSEIDEHFIYDKKIIVQIDSLLRLQRDNFDLIIIDECESLARYCTSTHFTKNPKSNLIVSNLEFRISDAKNVIIMDADLSDRCINYYTSIMKTTNDLNKIDTKVLINKYTPYQDYTIQYMTYSTWLNELRKKLLNNKKLAIPMASNNKAKDLYTKLKKDFPEKNIILIHKETSEEEKLIKLLKVNEIWINYDIVIYTPTVCMGVSFDPEHFDNIFGYGCHNSLGAQEFCQMLHRIRKPKDKNIYLSFDYYKYLDPNEDVVKYHQIEEMLCNDYYLTNNDLNNNLITKKYKRVGKERVVFYPYKEEPIYDLYIRNCIEKVNNKLNFTACFFGYTKFKNYQYSFFETDESDNLLKELKQIKKEREKKEKDDEVINMLKANVLTKEEYKEKCMRKDKYMKEEDLYEIRKYNFIKNYDLKEKEISEEIIRKYNNRTLMLNYNNLSSILKTENQNTNKKLGIMLGNQKLGDEFKNCYQEFTYKNRYTYHYYTIELLKRCGFNINNYDNKDKFISKVDLENNINIKLNNKTLVEFIKEEKYGLYVKFDCRKLINREIENEFNSLLKIVNNIINKQYGVKIKVLKKGKNKTYYLSTNKLWDDLPNQIKSKDLIDKKTLNLNSQELINDLDNNIFVNSESDDDSDIDI